MSKSRQSRRVAARKAKQLKPASRQAQQTRSLSRGLQAVNSCDPLYGLRTALFDAAGKSAEWAGIPMPLEGEHLIVEPSYPFAPAFARKPDPADDDGWRLRNSWYSRSERCEILIMEKEGKISWGRLPGMNHIRHDLRTLGCSAAWGIEQEGRAVQLLGEMLRHVAFKQYLLTGMFLETSKRSGVTYIFRKLRPTIAIAPQRGREGSMRMLCALCMHPIAYYADSWAGAMCPTDDVIAHLALMRADEAMFWRRCNQHPPYRPESGL